MFFYTSPHRRDLPQYYGSRHLALRPMAADTLELVAVARRGITTAWRDGFAYIKAGIMLMSSPLPSSDHEPFLGRRKEAGTADDGA